MPSPGRAQTTVSAASGFQRMEVGASGMARYRTVVELRGVLRQAVLPARIGSGPFPEAFVPAPPASGWRGRAVVRFWLTGVQTGLRTAAGRERVAKLVAEAAIDPSDCYRLQTVGPEIRAVTALARGLPVEAAVPGPGRQLRIASSSYRSPDRVTRASPRAWGPTSFDSELYERGNEVEQPSTDQTSPGRRPATTRAPTSFTAPQPAGSQAGRPPAWPCCLWLAESAAAEFLEAGGVGHGDLHLGRADVLDQPILADTPSPRAGQA